MIKPNFDSAGSVPALAHSIADTCRITSMGRTPIYEEIRRGRLKARKAGRRTVILDSDLREWLASLPLADNSANAA
jgi:hypothetical protein